MEYLLLWFIAIIVAISLIFGIFVSTLLTLVVIPVLYYAVYGTRRTRTRTHAEGDLHG